MNNKSLIKKQVPKIIRTGMLIILFCALSSCDIFQLGQPIRDNPHDPQGEIPSLWAYPLPPFSGTGLADPYAPITAQFSQSISAGSVTGDSMIPSLIRRGS